MASEEDIATALVAISGAFYIRKKRQNRQQD